MKHIVPPSLILTIVCVIGLGIAFTGIHLAGSQGEVKVTTIIGEESAIDGISVSFQSTSDERFDIQQTVSFGEKNQVKTEIESSFHTKDNTNEDYFKYLYLQNTKKDTSSLTYDICLGSPFITLSKDLNGPDLTVTLPEEAVKEMREQTVNYGYLRYVYDKGQYTNEVCSFASKNRYYFTFLNTFLQEGIIAGERTYPDIIYEGNTGLYSLPCNEDGSFPFIKYQGNYYTLDKIDIKSELQIPISNQEDYVVFGMNAVFDESMIALAVKEENQVYLYLYDMNLQCGIGKYPFFELPKDAAVTKAEIGSDQNMLMITGEYYQQGKADTTLKRYFAVGRKSTESLDNFELSLQYLIETEDREFIETPAFYAISHMSDCCYQNESIYCLFSQDLDLYNDRNRFDSYLLKFSENGIEYLGSFQTDFSDDKKIECTSNEEYQSWERVYDNLRFTN